MPIALTCGSCGRSFRVKDEFAGRKGRCPACREVLNVPLPEAERDQEAAIADALLADDPPGQERRHAVQAEAPEPGPRPVFRDEERPAPRRKRVEREARAPRVAFEDGWFGSINAGVVGGVLMILIAVVWFVGGLAMGYLFFYPPILLVVGLIAFFKGLAGGGD